MRIPLASLPLHAVDLDGRITLRRGSDDEPGARVVVLGCDADAVRAAAPHLGAVLWLSLCDGPPATTPGPSCDELAARLAERERELADVTRDRDTARRRLTAMRDAVAAVAWTGSVDNDPDAVAALDASDASDLRRIACALAARVDREPPQRAAGVGAGVAADVVDGWCNRLNHALRGDAPDLAGEVVSVVAVMRAAARQHDSGAVGRGERVERGQEGAAGGGVVAEAVELCAAVVGHVGSRYRSVRLVFADGGQTAAVLYGDAIEQLGPEGQRGRLLWVGEGGSVHSSTISPSVAAREAP